VQKQNDILTVATLNIDWKKNLPTVFPFLLRQRADVICLQEVCEDALLDIAEAAGAHYFYAPMCGGGIHGTLGTVGIAIFSRLPLRRGHAHYYVGDPARIVELDERTLESRHATTYRAVVFIEVQKGDTVYRIANTHFTWTPDGKADEFQRQDLQALLSILKNKGEFLLCGDFNAPRGGEIFSTLSRCLKDNVPANCISSLDPERHRVKTPLMVDGIFSTPGYTVSDATMTFGVSDHAALTARVSRK